MKHSYMKAVESAQWNRSRLEKRAALEGVDPRYRNELAMQKTGNTTITTAIIPRDPRYWDEVRGEKYNLYDKAKTTPGAQTLSSIAGNALTVGLGGLIGGGAMYMASRGKRGVTMPWDRSYEVPTPVVDASATRAGVLAGMAAPIILAAAMAKMHRPDTEAERVARLKKNKLKKALIPGYAVYDDLRTDMTAKDAIMGRTRRRDEAIADKGK